MNLERQIIEHVLNQKLWTVPSKMDDFENMENADFASKCNKLRYVDCNHSSFVKKKYRKC